MANTTLSSELNTRGIKPMTSQNIGAAGGDPAAREAVEGAPTGMRGGTALDLRTPLVSAIFDFDLALQRSYAGDIETGLTVARSSLSTARDSIGQPRILMPNRPRFTSDMLDRLPAGLLVEEATQNGAQSTQGGSGTLGIQSPGPGRLPTNWSIFSAVAGISWELLSKPSTFDSTYKLRIYGTATAGGTYILGFTPNGSAGDGFAIVQNDPISVSMWLQIIAGTAPAGNASVGLWERLSTGFNAGIQASSFLPQTDAPWLEEAQFIVQNASAAWGIPTVGFTIVNGATYDFTIAIMAPQIEKKAFSTSYVMNDPAADTTFTATGSMTGARTADDISLTNGAALLATPWSAMIAARASRFNLPNTTLWQADDGTANNRVTLRLTDAVLYLSTVKAGVTTNTRLGRWIPMTNGRVALACDGTQVRVSYNGKAAQSVPFAGVTLSRALVGSGAAGYWNSTVSRLAHYRGAMSNADLVQLATPTGLFDDFDRADGPIGTPPTGQAYRQIPQGISTTVRQHRIAGGKCVTTDSGGVKTNAYTSVDLAAVPRIMAIGVVWQPGATGGAPTLISQAQGPDVVSQIVQKSFHPGFPDAGSYWGTFADNVPLQQYSWANGTINRDGVTPYYFVVQIFGNFVAIRFPDGRVRRRADAAFGAAMGRWAQFETYFDAGKSNQDFVAVRFEPSTS